MKRFFALAVLGLVLSIPTLGFIGGAGLALLMSHRSSPFPIVQSAPQIGSNLTEFSAPSDPQATWDCEVVIVGGGLGGVSAAWHAMQSGAKTCLIELTPWLGGQISSQGVSAIDESLPMRRLNNYSASWMAFKQLIKQQRVSLPDWTGIRSPVSVAEINSCWVGFLCFPPIVGANASSQWLEEAAKRSPGSRWGTAIAFKGVELDPTGTRILAVHAVQRIPKAQAYQPLGRFSQELPQWYGWSSDPVFQKVHLKLQAPAGQTLMVIDATDTGEVVAWLGLPYRLGSEGRTDTGEPHAASVDNSDCTQAFTYPFGLGIHEDQGASRRLLGQIQPGFSRQEHRRDYSLQGFPMFAGKSLFQYRRIVSQGIRNPFTGQPRWGEITAVNWNRGNDWSLMDPPLLMSESQIVKQKQRHNWMGGLNLDALREAENHALLFAEWLLETQSTSRFPLTYLAGSDGISLMGTQSGLSMVPYIREGRRIRGRLAYGQPSLLVREQDIRVGYRGRDFRPTVVGVAHYAIDIHGCRYRDGRPSRSATSASVNEYQVRPILLPLESLIPQTIDNLLMGGKAIAVSHIVNAATRSHYGEWTIGSAAGSTAGWIATQKQPELTPTSLLNQDRIRQLQAHLQQLGIRLGW